MGQYNQYSQCKDNMSRYNHSRWAEDSHSINSQLTMDHHPHSNHPVNISTNHLMTLHKDFHNRNHHHLRKNRHLEGMILMIWKRDLLRSKMEYRLPSALLQYLCVLWFIDL